MREDDWYRFQARIGLPPEDMASGNPENPRIGRVTNPPSVLGFGRVIHESLRLDERRRLVPVSSPNRASTGRYGFRKSGKSRIWGVVRGIEEINAIENDVSTMWKKRTERLMKRRRQDVHDVYEKCQTSSLGRPWVPPSTEYITREAEREARRNRRKRARELSKNTDKKVESHRDGLSSDDEETTSQQVVYKDTMASALEKAAGVFVDAEDDFCRIERILNRFIDWLMVDPDSYKDAFISLCIPKILAPFIRLELLDWKPLEEPHRALESWSWYKQILSVGMNNTGVDMESPEISNIIPSVVEKVVLPKIAKTIREQWNPLSLRQSMNLSKVLNSLAGHYPTVNASSKQMLDVLNAIYARAKASIEEDTFVPLYSKEAIESPATGCGAFLDQQFWNSIKLMRSLRCFRYLISDNCLEEMMIEGIVNRSVVLALQFSGITDPAMLPKCMAVLEEIPTSWLPTFRPASYQSLASLLGRVITEHKSRERDTCKKLQEFVNLCQKEPIKKEPPT
ncbi:GC-rich sequence DNA-binding factor-like protein domain-containing protein [Ditylenchus destructor]|uniref:GC-rich sequence DNA-binding factor-like protein domain-containing protein n=1 Tax=Ditylenchus destructor TaxID=166010 RepID=A0AAD4R6T7_9BILA|nr:GC-rich sequence DNA-binding factor-like protein domain-containing protein [Ditylenchus destructor]